MNIILEERHFVLTEYGRYRVKYELLEDVKSAGLCYGIRVCQVKEDSGELFDICQVRGITGDLRRAEALFASLTEELVLPVSLSEVIQDWQYASSML